MSLLGSSAGHGGTVRIGPTEAPCSRSKPLAERANRTEGRIELDAGTREPGALETVRDAVGVVELSAAGVEREQHRP
jgi:hypothetical protein